MDEAAWEKCPQCGEQWTQQERNIERGRYCANGHYWISGKGRDESIYDR